jgi:hypothetical protein
MMLASAPIPASAATGGGGGGDPLGMPMGDSPQARILLPRPILPSTTSSSSLFYITFFLSKRNKFSQMAKWHEWRTQMLPNAISLANIRILAVPVSQNKSIEMCHLAICIFIFHLRFGPGWPCTGCGRLPRWRLIAN